jgi:hypothetical protein
VKAGVDCGKKRLLLSEYSAAGGAFREMLAQFSRRRRAACGSLD